MKENLYNIIKITISVILILIFIRVLLYIFIQSNPDFKQYTVKNEFEKNRICFEEIAELLIDYEATDVRISDREYINSTNNELNKLVYKLHSAQKISSMNYELIYKNEDRVYFYRYCELSVGRGLLYAPNGHRDEDNESLLKCIELADDWYYFVER